MLRQFPCPNSLSTAAPLDLDQQLSLASMPRAELPTTRAKMLSLVATGSSSLGRTLLRWFAQHCQAKAQTPFYPLQSQVVHIFWPQHSTFFHGGHRTVSGSLVTAKKGRLPPDPKERQHAGHEGWEEEPGDGACTAAQLHSWSPREHKSNSVTWFSTRFPHPCSL